MGSSEDFVLVVENAPNLINLITKSLQKTTNYHIKVAETFADAMHIMQNELPLLILTNIQLPDGNVLDMITPDAFRKLWPSRSENTVPVVVITSNNDEQTAIELIKNGIIDYIVITDENSQYIDKIINLAIKHWAQIIKQANTEKALYESEHKYRLIAENINDIIWTTDLNLNINFISTSVTKAIGYEPNELIDKNLLDLLITDSRAKIKNTADLLLDYFKTKNQNEAIETELELVDKNNTVFLFKTNIRLLQASDNKTIGLIGISRNITSHRKSREIIGMLTQAIEQSPVSIIITNTKGDIEYVNPKLIDITGYPEEELVGKNPKILKSGETPNDEYKSLWDTILNGNTWRGEFHNKKKNGDLYWEQATIAPVRDSKGEITHFIAVKEDITAIKKAQDQLIQSEEKFRQLAENLSQVFWLYDKKSNKILYISPSFEDLWGIPLARAYKSFTEWTQAIHPLDKDKVIHSQTKLLEQNELFAEEYRIVRKDGTIRWIWARAYPVPDENNYIYRIAGIAEDITIRKQVENDLRNAMNKAEESDRLKTAFLANISHEIRTPANGIIGFTELICREETTFEKRLYYADIITKSTNQLLSVVDDILDLARIETGQLTIVKENTNIQAIFNDLAVQYKSLLSSKGIELTEEYNIDENKTIYTDKTRVKQILNNLLSNAAKFTTKGKIKIGIHNTENHVQCFVEDTGIGIPENKKHLIFGRFQQADYEHSRLYGGIGLGLVISKSLTELLDGKMWFNSTHGKGSTFYFSLPDIDYSTPTNTTGINNSFKNIYKNDTITILTAEDENLNFLLIEDIFEGTNAKLLHAHDGFEAVEMCKSNPNINLILMDIKMPIMNGIEASLKIRKIKPKIPIIALSACCTDEDKTDALNSGCTDYIAKPFKIDNFLSIVNKYVSIKINSDEI